MAASVAVQANEGTFSPDHQHFETGATSSQAFRREVRVHTALSGSGAGGTLEPRRRSDGNRSALSRTAKTWRRQVDDSHASRYYLPMILSFKCADTQALANGGRVRRFANIESVARRKLRQLEIADTLGDLRVPPGNQLEALKHDRAGQHSIRVNGQYRVCFRWTPAGAHNVEIVDYH
jgi:proteic killer suppression protein